MNSLYSVVITTKNNEYTIKYVLSSTLTLAESYDTELVVVDGKSTDNTFTIVSNFAIKNKSRYVSLKVLKDPGFSLSFARHLGFKSSQGDVLIFLDGDTPLTTSFKHYLKKELENSDLISPLFECIPIDRATSVFNRFMKTISYLQNNIADNSKIINDPSILPPARIYKRKVLERIKGYPVSSRFFGEDRIATALAVKLGFQYKFSHRLRLLKIDELGYRSYWRKHYIYAIGIHRDLTPLGKSILRGYIIARRLNHINTVFPILSFLYACRSIAISRNIREALEVSLMKYLIDLAMFTGDLKRFIHGDK